jgi:DNA-binding CsgD family transcriptional regulator
MSLSFEAVEQLLAISRDATTGCSFEDRMTILAGCIARVIPHTSAMFTVFPLSPSEPDEAVRVVQLKSVPEVIREYAEHYYKLDPSHERCRAQIGKPFLLSDVVPHGRYGKDEYTSDCLQRAKMRHILGGWLPLPRQMALQLTFARPGGAEDFDARDLKLANLIAPDLIRAAFGALLSERLSELRKRGGPDERVGMIAFDTRGEIVLAQRAAIRICERVRPGGGGPGDVLAPLVLSLNRLGVNLPSGATAERDLPLTNGEWAHVTATQTPAGIICVLEVVSPGTAKHTAAVAASYGLTVREQEVAALAVKGLANKEIAVALKLSPFTVKLHLGNIYKKTHVESRTELASRFLGSAKIP